MEETGKANIEIEWEIGFRRHQLEWQGELHEVQEVWYLGRCEPFSIVTDGFTDSENADILSHRWWTLDEMRNTSDLLVPRGFDIEERSPIDSSRPAALHAAVLVPTTATSASCWALASASADSAAPDAAIAARNPDSKPRLLACWNLWYPGFETRSVATDAACMDRVRPEGRRR